MTDVIPVRKVGRPAVPLEIIFIGSMNRLAAQTIMTSEAGCWLTDTKTLHWPMPGKPRRKSVTPRWFVWMQTHRLPLSAAVRVDPLCKKKNCVNPDHLEARHRWFPETFAPLPHNDLLATWDVWTARTIAEQCDWVDVHNALFREDKRHYPNAEGRIVRNWSYDQYRHTFQIDGEIIPMCGNAGR